MSRLLVIEDEVALAQALRRGLTDEQFTVDVAHDGETGYSNLRARPYDMIILDLMLPRLSGMDLLKRIRGEKNRTPVLILTAKDTKRDIVAGLDAGANDYLTKPFSFDELLARIRALLRTMSAGLSSVVTVGDLSIDTAARRVTRAGTELALTAREYQVLEYLMTHAGQIISKERLIASVWPNDANCDPNAVEVCIAGLRKKVDRDPWEKLIQTVRGLGYVIRVLQS